MTLARTTLGINNAEDDGRKDAQIGFADALQRIFPTALARYLQFRDWIRQETVCNRMPIAFVCGNATPSGTVSVTFLVEATGRQD